MRRGRVRFAVEAAAIVLVAAVARLAELGRVWIIVLVLAAWVVTALFERMASQRLSAGAIAAIEAAVAAEEALEESVRPLPARAREEPLPERESDSEPVAAGPAAEPDDGEEQPEPEQRERDVQAPARSRRPGIWQRAQARLAEERRAPRRPRAGRGRASAAAGRPKPPERACASCGRPIPPERLEALPDALQCLDCKRASIPVSEDAGAGPSAVRVLPRRPVPDEPEPAAAAEPQAGPEPPEPEPEPAAAARHEPVAAAPPEPAAQPEPVAAAEPEPRPAAELPRVPVPVPVEPQRWNVWELERLARERSGQDVGRDEEWSFLLVYLREFADPDGALSTDFDALVRESFAELLGSLASR